MAKLTIGFGVVLVLIGIAGFVATGHTHYTALIPSWIGVILAVCGVLSMTEDAKRRKLWMHIAVTVGLIGFVTTLLGAVQTVQLAAGRAFEYPIKIEEKGATCLVCFIFVAFCVRSFIQARRERLA